MNGTNKTPRKTTKRTGSAGLSRAQLSVASNFAGSTSATSRRIDTASPHSFAPSSFRPWAIAATPDRPTSAMPELRADAGRRLPFSYRRST